MFVIGAILIVLAIIVVIYVTFATRSLDPLTIDWGPFTAALTPLQLFFLGAVAILVLAIGAVMFSIGLKSQGAKRAEVKALRKEVKAVQADKPGSNSDAAKSTKDVSTAPSDTKESGRRDARSDRGGSAPMSSADGSSTTNAPPAPAKSSGPRLPPPVPPRDTPTPPRTGSL